MAGSVDVFDINDQIRFTGAFSLSGTATAPGTAVLRVKNPDNTIGTVVMSADGAGTVRGVLTAGTAGLHYARIEGTTLVIAAAEKRFEVRPSQF